MIDLTQFLAGVMTGLFILGVFVVAIRIREDQIRRAMYEDWSDD